MTIFLSVYTGLLLIASLLPLIRHEYWIFRVFDYPRLQKLVLSGIGILMLVLSWETGNTLYLVLVLALCANAVYLSTQILPFTPLLKTQVKRSGKENKDRGISLIVANVYQDNDNCEGCLDVVKNAGADVVLLLETDSKWDKRTESLSDEFPFQVKVPLENTYGMLLYSKFELVLPKVRYLVEDDIPSIHTDVRLSGGELIRLIALHPTPPVPNENPRSSERDKELLLVADIVKDHEKPVVVIGDLNDVAWSYTTELFLKMSGLLDPRRGRGFFNTFHAHYPFLRFPLDHAFISCNMTMKEMRRLKNFDSDHFPIFISLQYEPQAEDEQQPLTPDAEDVEIAEEKKQAC